MDLIRKMSGLRSSQEMETVKDSWEDESDREGEAGNVDDDDAEGVDVFEDAAHGGQPEQQLTNGFDHDTASVPPIRVRAPLSDENDHEEEGVAQVDGAGDGHASSGSGESFDSALERMAVSSTASPKSLSPVESFKYADLEVDATNEFEAAQGARDELSEAQIPSPRDDDSMLSTKNGSYTNGASREKVFENGASENGEVDHVEQPDEGNVEGLVASEAANSLEVDTPAPESVQQSSFVKDDGPSKETDAGEAVIEELLSTIPEGSPREDLSVAESESAENGVEQPLTTPAMPTADDVVGSDGLEDGRDGKVDVDGEEHSKGIVGKEITESQPLQVRSALSDVDTGNERSQEESMPLKVTSEANGDHKDKEILPKVSEPASEVTPLTADILREGKTKDIDETNKLPEEPEGTGALPTAKLSADKSDSNGFDNHQDDTEKGEAVSDEKYTEVEDRSADVERAKTVDDSVDENPEVVSEKGSEVKSLRTETDKQPTDASQLDKSFEIPSQGKVEDEVKSARVHDLGEDEDEDEERDWDEEIEEDDEDDNDSVVERSAALAALVGAVDSAGDTPLSRVPAAVGETPTLGAAGPSLPARPSRIVRATPAGDSGARPVQHPRSIPASLSNSADSSQTNGEAPDGNEETREKLQAIRVKFLRLALRLGQSAHNVVVAQVLYRLGLAEQLRGGGRSNSRGGAFSFDRASAIAEEQEEAGPEELDFTCTIMLLGKTGVGKSATINSIFDEAKTGTNAFSPSTNKVQIITGNVHGIKVRVIDTPGLLPSLADQRHNEKVMASVKKFIRKQAPDIILYFDRLDMQSRDYGDLPLLRTITDTFGAAVWFNAIVVLTHASSAPPDGPNGLPLSYEMFVAQRSHVVQQTIRQAAGDMRLMNPVSLVENHPACRVNRSRQRVLPNGQVWKPQLLLLCFASKVLAEANSLLKLQDNTAGKPFGVRQRVPPLPFLLSSLLQSRAQLKLPDEQMGEEDESDEELDDDEDSDEEEDYDQLPPFRRLSKEEVAELDEDNRNKYFEELVERERLFQKKQWKEEKKRRSDLKRRMADASIGQPQFADEGVEDDMSRSAAVPVPMPDMVLPPSFDSDNPSYRYRYLESANQWLVRPVLETHGWDHDSGYDGMSVEKMFVIADKIPASASGQITKDKKEASVNMECAASLKHGEGKVTLAGLDVQTVGKDLAYTLRSETRFSNFKMNKTTGGLAVTLLGDTLAAGMKIENRLIAGKRVKLVLNGGAMTGRDDIAYGGSLEATLRDKDYPLSRTLSTLGISVMDWHGDLAVGGNLQSQLVVGKTMMVARANLNNRGAGQISLRASSSEQLQMALIGILPIIRSLVNRLFGSQPQQ